MRKLFIIMMTVSLAFLMSCTARGFSAYAQDGSGGTYRAGQKVYLFIFPVAVVSYMEHCTVNTSINALSCKALDMEYE